MGWGRIVSLVDSNGICCASLFCVNDVMGGNVSVLVLARRRVLLSSLVVCRGGSSPEHPAPGLLIFSCGYLRTLALAGLQHQFVEGRNALLQSLAALSVALPVALPVALLVHQYLSLLAPAHI